MDTLLNVMALTMTHPLRIIIILIQKVYIITDICKEGGEINMDGSNNGVHADKFALPPLLDVKHD